MQPVGFDIENRREQSLSDEHEENKFSFESSTPVLEILQYLKRVNEMLEVLGGELKNTQPKIERLDRDELSRRQNPRIEALHILALILGILAALLTIIAYILGVF